MFGAGVKDDEDGTGVLGAEPVRESGVAEPETPRISAMAADETAASLLDLRNLAL